MDEQQRGASSFAAGLGRKLPRVLVVSRRTVRKNKFVDFVGEYHLDLILKNGAVPVIVPRVPGVDELLESFEPIHGVLLCEGEDIDPKMYEGQGRERERSSRQQQQGVDDWEKEEEDDDESYGLSPEDMAEIRKAHASDTTFDNTKDSIELSLAKRCLERCIPFLGICRGSQVLNVACGGALYQDVETQLAAQRQPAVKHIDYDNYDSHRHSIRVVSHTPLAEWFDASLKKSPDATLMVNSYHHQGVRVLASRLAPMAFAADGLIEAFYDPDSYDPSSGRFIVGLQFHPERMRRFQEADHSVGGKEKTREAEQQQQQGGGSGSESSNGRDLQHDGEDASDLDPQTSSVFDYPECPRAYQEFGRAVVAYHRRLQIGGSSRRDEKWRAGGEEMERDGAVSEQLRAVVRSFETARSVWEEEQHQKQQARDASNRGASLAHAALSSCYPQSTSAPKSSTMAASSRPPLPIPSPYLSRSNSHATLAVGAIFLEENTVLTTSQVQRLSEMGATVRNASKAMATILRVGDKKEQSNDAAAISLLAHLTTKELEGALEYHRQMAQVAANLLESRK